MLILFFHESFQVHLSVKGDDVHVCLLVDLLHHCLLNTYYVSGFTLSHGVQRLSKTKKDHSPHEFSSFS